MKNQLTPHPKLEAKLAGILSSYDARSDTNAVQFALASPSRGWTWEWRSSASPRQFFIASTTKLYVTAIIMQLCEQRQVNLDAPAGKYLDPAIMAGIHVLRGVDSSHRITVRELLSHTSGIADYFEQRRADGRSQFQDALRADFAWSFEDVLRITKEELQPKFAPSTPGKAFYSDTNYQLLGALIESMTGQTFEEVVQSRVTGRWASKRRIRFPRKPWTAIPRSLRCYTGRSPLPFRRQWPLCEPMAEWSRRPGKACSFSKR